MQNFPGGVIPAAVVRHETDLPLIELAPGLSIQLLQVDFDHNIRITRARMNPGVRLPTHTHTGCVYAWTMSGSWRYIEYSDINDANSYLFEPAGSVHTLEVPEENSEPADVIFIVNGSNIDHAEDGSIKSITDAASIARVYLQGCKENGFDRPDVIGLPDDWE